MRHRLLLCALLAACAALGVSSQAHAAPSVDPELRARLPAAAPDRQLAVLLTFHGDRVTDAQVAAVRSLGIDTGVRMRNLPIVAVNATPAQVARLLDWNELRSVYLNAPLEPFLHQTKPLIGVSRLRDDQELRSGNFPYSGRGVTIAINDSGIDAGHPDLKMDLLNRQAGRTIQNVLVTPNGGDGLLVRTGSTGGALQGILPAAYVENVVNTDTHVGHGTHCAGIAAGSGQASGGLYQGVAPGAKLVGLGSGGILFVLAQVASFDYVLTNAFDLNIKVVSNSWGNSAVALDPDHPINVASKALHDAGIVVVFAAGNDGPRPATHNRWASFPWLISVGSAQKNWRLTPSSSRGVFGTDVRPTVLAPGTGGPAAQGHTAAVVAARSATNVVANGADADAEIPPAYLPFYTQISGTSMACPHVAGVAATILEANPNLSPDEVKRIIERTATPLGVYDEFEVGAGMANVHAAVDLALHPEKLYGQFGFTGKGLALSAAPAQNFSDTVAPAASKSHAFEIPANTRFAFVQLDWEGSAGEDELVVDNTRIVMNDLALAVQRDGANVAASNKGNLAALFGAREAIKLEFPAAGTYTARVSAGLNGAGILFDQPYRLKVVTYAFDPNEAADVAHLDAATRQKVFRLLYDRVMFASDGAFRPDSALTRMELARALFTAAHVMQYLPNRPSFSDLAPNTADALVAESLRRDGIMGAGVASFGPAAEVSRLEQAVALVRALGLDAQARALAGTDVKVGSQTVTDNAQIPSALRGYVQLALDRGLMETFPLETRQVYNGQFIQVTIIPGPRFEPERVVKRSEFVNPATKLLGELYGE
ncbi:MAG TPA: S8 family serine peptidase [Pyrinomonadaceae bacterium]|nr:S8 family serine peptidase [Pyrinomonadaceae bacterium]